MATSENALSAHKLFDLTGRVALVTGGATGIGLMHAEALAANGAKVYIVGRRQEKLDAAVKHYDTTEKTGKLIALQGDVSNKDGIRKVRDEIASKEEHLSILVNNAGINDKNVDTTLNQPDEIVQNWFEQADEDSFASIYQVDVYAYFFMATAFVSLLAKGNEKFGPESSVVLSICSMSGEMAASQQGQFAYNSAKAATIQMVKLLAHEFARPSLRIRSVGISPGCALMQYAQLTRIDFPSEMTSKADSNEKGKTHFDDHEEVRSCAASALTPRSTARRRMCQVLRVNNVFLTCAAGRPGSEEDMAQLALCMVTNRYINGEIVRIDGGHLLHNP